MIRADLVGRQGVDPTSTVRGTTGFGDGIPIGKLDAKGMPVAGTEAATGKPGAQLPGSAAAPPGGVFVQGTTGKAAVSADGNAVVAKDGTSATIAGATPLVNIPGFGQHPTGTNVPGAATAKDPAGGQAGLPGTGAPGVQMQAINLPGVQITGAGGAVAAAQNVGGQPGAQNQPVQQPGQQPGQNQQATGQQGQGVSVTAQSGATTGATAGATSGSVSGPAAIASGTVVVGMAVGTGTGTITSVGGINVSGVAVNAAGGVDVAGGASMTGGVALSGAPGTGLSGAPGAGLSEAAVTGLPGTGLSGPGVPGTDTTAGSATNPDQQQVVGQTTTQTNFEPPTDKAAGTGEPLRILLDPDRTRATTSDGTVVSVDSTRTLTSSNDSVYTDNKHGFAITDGGGVIYVDKNGQLKVLLEELPPSSTQPAENQDTVAWTDSQGTHYATGNSHVVAVDEGKLDSYSQAPHVIVLAPDGSPLPSGNTTTIVLDGSRPPYAGDNVIVIIDNDSTDGTGDIKYVNQEGKPLEYIGGTIAWTDHYGKTFGSSVQVFYTDNQGQPIPVKDSPTSNDSYNDAVILTGSLVTHKPAPTSVDVLPDDVLSDMFKSIGVEHKPTTTAPGTPIGSHPDNTTTNPGATKPQDSVSAPPVPVDHSQPVPHSTPNPVEHSHQGSTSSAPNQAPSHGTPVSHTEASSPASHTPHPTAYESYEPAAQPKPVDYYHEPVSHQPASEYASPSHYPSDVPAHKEIHHEPPFEPISHDSTPEVMHEEISHALPPVSSTAPVDEQDAVIHAEGVPPDFKPVDSHELQEPVNPTHGGASDLVPAGDRPDPADHSLIQTPAPRAIEDFAVSRSSDPVSNREEVPHRAESGVAHNETVTAAPGLPLPVLPPEPIAPAVANANPSPASPVPLPQPAEQSGMNVAEQLVGNAPNNAPNYPPPVEHNPVQSILDGVQQAIAPIAAPLHDPVNPFIEGMNQALSPTPDVAPLINLANPNVSGGLNTEAIIADMEDRTEIGRVLGNQDDWRVDEINKFDDLDKERRERYELELAENRRRDEEAREDREQRELEERAKRFSDAMLAAMATKKCKQPINQVEEAFVPEVRQKYVVLQGDTLESIAIKKLRDKRLAPLLYEINKHLIPARMQGDIRYLQLAPRSVIQLPTQAEIRRYHARLFGRQSVKFQYEEPTENCSSRSTNPGLIRLGLVPALDAVAAAKKGEDADKAASRRANVESLLGTLSKTQAPPADGRIRYICRLGDTLRSVAMRHPALKDVTLWKLLAEANSLTTDVDDKGTPLGQFKRGSTISLPTLEEIEAFKLKFKPKSSSTGNRADKITAPQAPYSVPAASDPSQATTIQDMKVDVDDPSQATTQDPLVTESGTVVICDTNASDSVASRAGNVLPFIRPGDIIRYTPPGIAMRDPEDATNSLLQAAGMTPRDGSQRDTSDRGARNVIHHLNETCRIVLYGDSTTDGSGFRTRLEVRQEDFWRPVVQYEVNDDVTLRHEFSVSGKRTTNRIDLPPHAAKELAENDISAHWERYSNNFQLGRKIAE
jgi:hypothetical protein